MRMTTLLRPLVVPHQSVPGWCSAPQDAQRPSSFNQLFKQHQGLASAAGLTTPYLEIGHDALLRNWPMFDDWPAAESASNEAAALD